MIPWRKEWLPTPIFLPGEFHGQRSLKGHSSQRVTHGRVTNTDTHTHTHRHTRREAVPRAYGGHADSTGVPTAFQGCLVFTACPRVQPTGPGWTVPRKHSHMETQPRYLRCGFI